MNMTIATTPVGISDVTQDPECEPNSIDTISIEISEESQPKRLTEYEDNYLRTLLDEKCLMHPPQKLKQHA